MKINSFIKDLVKEKPNSLETFIDCALNDFTEEPDLQNVKSVIKSLGEHKITMFGDRIGLCIDCCDKKLKSLENREAEGLFQKIKTFKVLLIKIADSTQEICDEYAEKAERQKDASIAVQQNSDVIQELTNKVSSVQNDLKKTQEELNDTVKKADDRIDNKIFGLLINTVAVLGIFVAIAFAGFGTMSIISGLDFSLISGSVSGFIKSIFFMLLIALLSYNLLLLLIYFIFKLSRPIMRDSKLDIDKKDKSQAQSDKEADVNDFRFLYAVKLTPFFVIDGILFILAVASFIACFCVK